MFERCRVEARAGRTLEGALALSEVLCPGTEGPALGWPGHRAAAALYWVLLSTRHGI